MLRVKFVINYIICLKIKKKSTVGLFCVIVHQASLLVLKIKNKKMVLASPTSWILTFLTIKSINEC